MNTFERFASKAMPSFSTDQTALSVNRFVAARPTLMSRSETSAPRRYAAGIPFPLEVLYPSLYAERSSLAQRCGTYLRAIAMNVGKRFTASEPLS